MEGLGTLAVPIILAFMTGGGIVAFFRYLETRPENREKARRINVTAETTLSEGWRKYAEKMEKRLDEIEEANERRVHELMEEIETLRRQIRENEEAHKRIVEQKDQEITRLKRRVGVLERELEKATGKPPGTFADEEDLSRG